MGYIADTWPPTIVACKRLCKIQHLACCSGVHEQTRSDGDEDLELAEGDDVASLRPRPLAEAACIVVDEVERAEPLEHAREDTLARPEKIARPDEHSSQRRCWPHGGRQLSWWYHGRCHRMAIVGADVRCRIRGGLVRCRAHLNTSEHKVYPGSGPL